MEIADLPKYLLELRITNMEAKDILSGNRLEVLLRKLLDVWPQADNLRLVVTKLNQADEINSPVPLIIGVMPNKGYP